MVPDLVWSVQPKINPDDRKRLVKTIPAVLNTVREGLQLIEYSPTQTQEFFTRLMGSHAQAVKALEVAYGAAPPVDAGALKQRLDEVKIVEPPPPSADDATRSTTDHSGLSRAQCRRRPIMPMSTCSIRRRPWRRRR